MIENAFGIHIVDPDQDLVARLRAAVPASGLRLLGSHATVDQALPTLLSVPPDVVVLDVAATKDVPGTIRKLAASCPDTYVIVTGAGAPPALMSKAVAAGARGFLIKPYAVEDLVSTVREVVENARNLGHARPRGERAQRGRLLAVYSPKGGVGTTTTATNLAVALASRANARVALIDLDLQFGDVGAVLDLHSANSIAELIGHGELGLELIDETFMKHTSGLRVLVAPDDLEVVSAIDPDDVIRLLEQLRPFFDYIVCDLWSSFEDLTIGVLRAADRVLLVTTPELPALRNLQRVLNSTRPDVQLDDKVLVVANRFPGKTGLSREDMTKAVGRPIAATVPSEGVSVTDAINRGVSLLDARLHVKIARNYHDLAALITKQASVPVPRASGAMSPSNIE
ncbi:MAG: AAA family ATPase [Chloroflexota bacterium]|nr:AAA family ATPase [Chloroflexota bacterium]